jgi:ABC-type lipoprotein release transport system permease subunit
LAIRCPEEHLDSVASFMAGALPGYSVQKWYEVNPTLQAMQGMMAISTLIMVLIVLVALIFGLINTMLMVVMERRKELGMLRALGLKNSKVARMIVLETVLLGILGGMIGNLLSYIAIKIFGNTGIKFESAAEGLEQFGMGDTLYPELQAYMYVLITMLVLLTALLASIFPARRALRQDIAATIRN